MTQTTALTSLRPVEAFQTGWRGGAFRSKEVFLPTKTTKIFNRTLLQAMPLTTERVKGLDGQAFVGDVRGFTVDAVTGVFSSSPADIAVSSAVGLTTSSNLIPAAGRVKDLWEQRSTALYRGDTKQAQELLMNATAQGTMALAAGSMLAVRPLTWALNFSTSSTLRLAQTSGMQAASGLFCAFFGLFSALQVKQIFDLNKAKEKLLSSSLKEFFQKTTPDEIAIEISKNSDWKEECRKLAYQQGAIWMKGVCAEMREEGADLFFIEKLSDSEKMEKIKGYFQKESLAWKGHIEKEFKRLLGKEEGHNFWQKCLYLAGQDVAVACGLALKAHFANEIKEGEWSRLFGKENVATLKDTTLSEVERRDLGVALINARKKDKKWQVFICVLEIISIVLPLVVALPGVALFGTLGYAATSLYWYIKEKAGFEEWLKNGSAGSWDKAAAWTGLVLGALSIGAIIAVSHGSLPLIALMIAVIGGISIGVNRDLLKKHLPESVILGLQAVFGAVALGCAIALIASPPGVGVMVLLTALAVQALWISTNIKVIHKIKEDKKSKSSILKAKRILDAALSQQLSDEESRNILKKLGHCYQLFCKKEQDLVTKKLRGRALSLKTFQVIFTQILEKRQAFANRFMQEVCLL